MSSSIAPAVRCQIPVDSLRSLRGGLLPFAAVVVALALMASTAAAQPPDPKAETQAKPAKAAAVDLMEMDLDALANVEVSVAGAKKETVMTAGSTVTVLDRKTLDNYNFRSVSAAVETLAGMQVWRSYLKQGIPTARAILQENYANKVLVLINNVPVWNAVTGEGELERVDIDDVERIEVMRGPGSVIYGSQAFAGAINLVLRDAKPGSGAGSVRGGFGTDGAWGTGASYRWASAGGFALFASVNHEEGHRRTVAFRDEVGTVGAVEDFIDVQSSTVNLQYKGHSLLFNGYQRTEGYFGVTPRISGGAGNPHDGEGWMTSYRLAHKWSEHLETDVTAFFDQNSRSLSRAADDSVRANVDGYRTGVGVRNRFAMTDAVGFELGGDYEFRKSIEYRNYNTRTGATLTENGLADMDVYEYSVYGQADWRWKKLQMLGGTRLTRNQLFGNDVSPRGTLAYHANEKNVVKVMAGQAFRTPNLFELFFHTTPATVEGEAGLKPEKNTTIELLYQHSSGGLYVQPGVYYAVYDSKIYRESVGGGVSRYANGASFSATGVELEVKYIVPKWVDTFVNIDYVHGTDGDRVPGTTHYNFKYVPTYTVSAGVSKAVGPVSASAVFNTVGKMEGPRADVDGYQTVDVNVAATHTMGSAKVRHALAFVNAFDADVIIPQYVARPTNAVNSMPLGGRRGFFYSIHVTF